VNEDHGHGEESLVKELAVARNVRETEILKDLKTIFGVILPDRTRFFLPNSIDGKEVNTMVLGSTDLAVPCLWASGYVFAANVAPSLLWASWVSSAVSSWLPSPSCRREVRSSAEKSSRSLADSSWDSS